MCHVDSNFYPISSKGNKQVKSDLSSKKEIEKEKQKKKNKMQQ